MLEAMILSPRQRAELDEATASYESQMAPEAAQYLLARGISKEAAVGARLGFVAEAMPGHEAFIGRLAIPYLANGHVVSLKFRTITNAGTKYLGISGQHPRLYGVDVLRESHPTVAIVEGELDALLMTRVIGVPAVSVPGSGTWLPHMPRCFADVEQVLVVCDSDEAGQALGQKIAKSIRGSKIIQPPDECDITDWYLAEGAEHIRTKLGVNVTS